MGIAASCQASTFSREYALCVTTRRGEIFIRLAATNVLASSVIRYTLGICYPARIALRIFYDD